MENKEKTGKDYFTIDVFHLVKSLGRQVWLIAMCGLLTAAIGFFIAVFAVTPTYSSYVKMYVRNNAYSAGNGITSSEISAAKSLVRTYGEILDSRSTLELVVEKAEVEYTWKKLSSMITYSPSDDTETMKIIVTSENPYEASKIANAIAEVLPERISEIIDGTSMKLIDSAVPNFTKNEKGVAWHAAMGMVIGVALTVVVLSIIILLDNTVHDEEYVLRTYDYPILGKIPDLVNISGKASGYEALRSRNADNGRRGE